MPIYLLGEDTRFPSPEMASPEGIIAIGGDLSPQRLLNAYASGIFPWYSEDEPILWWSPDPRSVLLPGDLHVSRSMKKLLEKKKFSVKYDRDFKSVIENCGAPRKKEQGTWITSDIKEAYISLHRLGFAHSVEVYQDNKLVGGLYGVSLGKCFFGESMFSLVPNASKYAFITFVREISRMGFLIVDCQVPNPHLTRLGAREIPRAEFLERLEKGLQYDTLAGKWEFMNER
jgi:leucyl/phenylalanyl-tRNA---protein transferase